MAERLIWKKDMSQDFIKTLSDEEIINELTKHGIDLNMVNTLDREDLLKAVDSLSELYYSDLEDFEDKIVPMINKQTLNGMIIMSDGNKVIPTLTELMLDGIYPLSYLEGKLIDDGSGLILEADDGTQYKLYGIPEDGLELANFVNECLPGLREDAVDDLIDQGYDDSEAEEMVMNEALYEYLRDEETIESYCDPEALAVHRPRIKNLLSGSIGESCTVDEGCKVEEGCKVDESISLPPLKNSDERLKLVDELAQIKQMSLADLTGLDLLATDMSDGSVEELFPIFAKVATAYIKEIAQKDEKNNKDRINYWWWDFDKSDLKAVIKACELLVPNDKYPEGKSVVRGIARFLSDDDEVEESLKEAAVSPFVGDDIINKVRGYEMQHLPYWSTSADVEHIWRTDKTGGNSPEDMCDIIKANICYDSKDDRVLCTEKTYKVFDDGRVEEISHHPSLDKYNDYPWLQKYREETVSNESLTEANNNKCWVLFFDETGHNRAGSEWSHAFNTQPNIAERRILAPDYVKPKGAVGYMILSDSEFNSLDYDTIDKNYKRWGKKLRINESLAEDFTGVLSTDEFESVISGGLGRNRGNRDDSFISDDIGDVIGRQLERLGLDFDDFSDYTEMYSALDDKGKRIVSNRLRKHIDFRDIDESLTEASKSNEVSKDEEEDEFNRAWDDYAIAGGASKESIKDFEEKNKAKKIFEDLSPELKEQVIKICDQILANVDPEVVEYIIEEPYWSEDGILSNDDLVMLAKTEEEEKEIADMAIDYLKQKIDKMVGESLVEASSYANAAEYADTYRGRLADITIYKVGDKFTTNYGTTHVTGDTVEEVKGKLEDLMDKDFKKAQGYLEDLHEDDDLDDRKKAIMEEINSCQDLEEDAGEDEGEYKNPNVVNSAPITMF